MIGYFGVNGAKERCCTLGCERRCAPGEKVRAEFERLGDCSIFSSSYLAVQIVAACDWGTKGMRGQKGADEGQMGAIRVVAQSLASYEVSMARSYDSSSPSEIRLGHDSKRTNQGAMCFWY